LEGRHLAAPGGWNEFLRVSTHARVFPRPLDATRAMQFLDALLGTQKFEVLSAGPEHWHWLREVIAKTARPAGNLFFDIRTVALMREHGIKEIFSADTDFRQFEGIAVTNPLLEKRK
jgi:uncharacterized protein